MRHWIFFLAVSATVFLKAGNAVTIPYNEGNDGYTIIALDGIADTEGAIWDLSKLHFIKEIPLHFDITSDITFTGTTDDTRQTYTIRDGITYLTRSETPFTVGFLTPGVLVDDNGRLPLTMRGRTHQHDYYFGDGETSHDKVGEGRLIRSDGDTIHQATLHRTITDLLCVMDLHPIKGLDMFPDSVKGRCRVTTHTWRDSIGAALAQCITRQYTYYDNTEEVESGTFLILDNNRPYSIGHRNHRRNGNTLTASLGDQTVTIDGLDPDFDGTQVTISDIAGRIYHSSHPNCDSGNVSIHTTLPPDPVIVTVIQSTTTTFKLSH